VYVRLYDERGREVADASDTMVATYRGRRVARTCHDGSSVKAS
jgi:hypothetical protein